MKRSTRPVHRLTPQLALMGGIMAISPMSVDMYLPAFPAIANDLHATAAEVSNTLAVFLLAMGVGQLFTGPLADRYGRRRPLLGGLIGFALTAALCAVATNIGLFTFARALAALSVCMTSVCIRAMVRDRYDPVEGARVMSIMMLVSGLGPVLGPLAGSLILAWGPWRAIFWVLTITGLLFVLGALRTLPESQTRAARSTLAPATVARDYLVLLRSRDLMVPSLAAGLAFFGVFAYVAGTPSVLIAARGLSQTTYGLIFGTNALGMVVLSQFNRRWLTRHHPLRLLRRALRVQAAATALGLGLACFMPLPLPVLWAVLLCYIAPVSLVGGNSTVLAMARHGQHAGKAAAVNGMVTMAVGGLGASMVGLLHDGTERPLLLLMCLASLGAVALVHLLPPAADGAPADAN